MDHHRARGGACRRDVCKGLSTEWLKALYSRVSTSLDTSTDNRGLHDLDPFKREKYRQETGRLINVRTAAPLSERTHGSTQSWTDQN